jgi:hypothetical protein
MQFTDEQIDKLYKIADVHFEWYTKFNPDANVKFEDVLKLNHQKLTDILSGCGDCSSDMIEVIFDSILKDYTDLLNNLD